MANHFLFSAELKQRGQGTPERHLTLFSPHEEWNIAAIEKEIGTFVSSHRLPRAGLVVIGLEPHLEAMRRFCDSYADRDPHGILYRSTDRYHRNTQEGIRIIYADSVGRLHEVGLNGSTPEPMPPDQQDVIRKTGCRTIFDRRNARVRALGNHHFEKPSGKHSLTFIRAGNVMVKGAEVSFLSLWLLAYFHPGTTRIYLDTGSIGWVAAELLRLKQILTNRETHCAVDSFSSYDGLLGNSNYVKPDKSLPFEFDAHTLFIISATSSGDLSGILNSRHSIPKERIVTLFYDKREDRLPDTTLVICQPWVKVNDELGEEKIDKSYPSTSCKYCTAGSQSTRIAGDNFMLESNPPQAVLIAKRHAPTWLPTFQRRAFGKNIVRCFRRHPGSIFPNEISMDIDLLTKSAPEGSKLAERFETFLRGAVPASVRWVVHMADPGAQHIAESVEIFCNRIMGSHVSVKVMEGDRFLREVVATEEFKKELGSLVVTAGAVATGVTLLKFSQQIRAIREKIPVTFIVGLSRSSNPVRRMDVKTSLITKREGPPAAFHELEQIYLADESESELNSWSVELAFLLQEVKTNDHPLHGRLLTLLETDQGTTGLIDNVFLPCPKLHPLVLRPDFVFLDRASANSPKTATQAEVYFTMASVLRNLREGHVGPETELFRDSLAHPVLAPSNFERFDDGIVQAALLRAAKPSELDYHNDRQYSEQMKVIISGLARDADSDHGEGLFEFFLAMATDRLRLKRKDMDRLLTSIDELVKESSKAVYKSDIFKAWLDILKRHVTESGKDS